MSQRGTEDMLRRALAEPDFLQQLILKPASVLAAYDLDTEERAIFTAHTPEELLALATRQGVTTSCDPHTCNVTQASGAPTPTSEGDYRLGHISPGIRAVVERARSDPHFFRLLQANSGEALKGIALTRAEREVLDANSATRLLGLFVTLAGAGCGDGGTCGETCSHTCSGGYTMSCGGTCDVTCDYTAGRAVSLQRTVGGAKSHQINHREGRTL